MRTCIVVCMLCECLLGQPKMFIHQFPFPFLPVLLFCRVWELFLYLHLHLNGDTKDLQKLIIIIKVPKQLCNFSIWGEIFLSFFCFVFFVRWSVIHSVYGRAHNVLQVDQCVRSGFFFFFQILVHTHTHTRSLSLSRSPSQPGR